LHDIPEASPAPPILVVLSGPSGVGKDAALSGLRQLDRPWHFVITATTRPPRPGERDGVDHVFLDNDTFLKMRERDEFLETAEVYGRWYGTPRAQVRKALKDGKDVILRIDVQGVASVKAVAPEAVGIVIVPESLEDLRWRLTDRGSNASDDLELRLAAAREELAQVSLFDYRVVNRQGQLEQTVAEIDAIITSEKCRVMPRVVQLL
jgi:guanylate kinase